MLTSALLGLMGADAAGGGGLDTMLYCGWLNEGGGRIPCGAKRWSACGGCPYACGGGIKPTSYFLFSIFILFIVLFSFYRID